jgi:hypothetical protein
MTERKVKQQKKRRPSFIWPIILITLGVMFLLSNLGIIEENIWNQFWRLWPLLFVVVGLDSLFRRNEIAGPVFMIGLGLVILFSSFGLIGWGSWDILWRLWPILLVAVGLEIIIGRRYLWISTLAVLLIVAGIGSVLWFFGEGVPVGTELEDQFINQPLDTLSDAEILIRPTVGELNVSSLSDSTALVDGEIQIGNRANVYEDFRVDGDTGKFKLDTRSAVYWPGTRPWQWNLSLTTRIPLQAEFSMAVGQMNLELSEMTIAQLDAKQAVGEMNISLAAKDDYSAEISQAVGSIVIELPEDVGLKIEINKALSSLSLPSSFESRGDYYYSSNFENAEYQVELIISQAVGSILLR